MAPTSRAYCCRGRSCAGCSRRLAAHACAECQHSMAAPPTAAHAPLVRYRGAVFFVKHAECAPRACTSYGNLHFVHVFIRAGHGQSMQLLAFRSEDVRSQRCGAPRRGRQSHSCTTLYIFLVIFCSKYTGAHQNVFQCISIKFIIYE